MMKDLVVDDEEFISCHHCKSSLQVYNNASSASISPTHIDEYSQALLSFDYLNCEKCGLFIKMMPDQHTEESLIFVCSNSIPHRHCLCFDCGMLYNLKNEKQSSSSIRTQMQYTSASDTVSAEIEAKTSSTNNDGAGNVLPNDGTFTNVDIINGTAAFSAEIVRQISTPNNEEHNEGSVQSESSMDDNDGSTLAIGTVMALMVWLSSVQASKNLRFTIWCIVVYFLTSVYFTDDSMKNAVFSLFSFSPIVASFYVFEKTRNLKEGEIESDVQKAIQFLCVFGCISYQTFYWGPMQMSHFLINDFMKLSVLNQCISMFIAASIAFFILILTKNCLCLQRMVISTNKSVDDVATFQQKEEELSFCELSIGLDQCNEIKEQKKKPKKRRRRKKKKKILNK